jgi:hypothetical protein
MVPSNRYSGYSRIPGAEFEGREASSSLGKNHVNILVYMYIYMGEIQKTEFWLEI